MSGLTLYKASAGSGKTFRLTGEYLRLLFENPGLYRHILAVTFTNKATAEMKQRILDELNRLARDEESGYHGMLRQQFGLERHQIKERAGLILKYILHDYSRFSVSTIDRFFQRVLRTFARELGLQSGYTLETDHSEILSFVVDELLVATEADQQLRRWLVEFAQTRMMQGKSWRFRDEIMNLADELTREEVKDLRLGMHERLNDRNRLSGYVSKLKEERSRFEQTMAGFGKQATGLIQNAGLTVDHFNNKGTGVARYFYYLREKREDKFQPNKTVLRVLNDPDRWPAGKLDKDTRQLVIGLARDQLNDLLNQAVGYLDRHYELYLSAGEVLKNIYVLGLLVDIQQRMNAWCREKNIFLIADAGDLLRKIVEDNEAPFIYEKTGSIFHHFMMDEFQDTSRFQWDNFRPLLDNSLSQHHFNLMVGDVKQSIYRWRNGDWKILEDEVEQAFASQTRSVALDANWRSRENVVAFNNTLFHYLPAVLQNQYNGELKQNGMENPYPDKLLSAYRDVRQKIPRDKPGGRIETRFFTHTHQQEGQAKEKVEHQLIADIRKLQDENYRLSDIAVMVRTNRQGQEIADVLTRYAKAMQPGEDYRFDFISNDSLYLQRAESVKLICSLFRFLVQPDDPINQAYIRDGWLNGILKAGTRPEDWHGLFKHQEDDPTAGLPEEFKGHVEELKKMPLYELTERLIRIFRINEVKDEIPYIQAFQEIVLSYSRRYASDLSSFLQWWKANGAKQKLQLPENYDAIRITTIHKAKGLEFKAVLIPFCNWELNTFSAGLKKNYLWCRPDRQPLNEVGVVPVEYSSRLSSTIFKEAYYDELFHNYVDNLNLLYVAFTRAEEVLIHYVTLKVKKDGTPNYLSKDKGMDNVGELIHFVYENHSGLSVPEKDRPFIGKLKDGWEPGGMVFAWGGFPKAGTGEASAGKQLVQESYPVYHAKPPLHLRYEHSGFFTEQKDLFQSTVDYGAIMHRVFEYIHTRDDIDQALGQVYLEGKINRGERDELRSRIEDKIDQAHAGTWFSGEWKVYTEQEILLTNGKTYRPDRVMVRGDETVVLDYKFGAYEDEKYKKQIKRYLRELKKMGYHQAVGYLWYMNQNKVVEVTE